jgi:hypothetical protein
MRDVRSICLTVIELRIVVLPEEIAAKHPRLYHVTRPDAMESIRSYGLLSTTSLLTLLGVPRVQRELIESTRRPRSLKIKHSVYGTVTISDNAPLGEDALATCLDDGLSTADWMRMLNQRVFFWVDEKNLDSHLRASTRRGEECLVLVFDTYSVVSKYYYWVELAAINTGSTMRHPARRGLTTFSPVYRYTYGEWRRLRGGYDRIKELTIVNGINDVNMHMTSCYAFPQIDTEAKLITALSY